ncbi:MAG TPA: hypothetical protein EYP14_12180, partial [Planctomycetaceae bacterium]|nr:hypothetical protein [Planctomycetaceae bacterium]
MKDGARPPGRPRFRTPSRSDKTGGTTGEPFETSSGREITMPGQLQERFRTTWLIGVVVAWLVAWGQRPSSAVDWPMWRYDAARLAEAPGPLPDRMRLQWVRHFPPLEPAHRNPRLQFDAGYEPIVVGETLLVGSSRNDRLTALDTGTGEEKWRFYTDGPIRVAPAAWRDKLFLGSDDGWLYCLSVNTGRLLWKFQAVPSGRKVLGNRRLISVWPVRGGPVVADGTVYFAAGVWPFEGIFVYALDAETGKVRWLNDRTGALFTPQPHGTHALSGLTPQGYLAVRGDELIVPCGAGTPARFDRRNGQLIEFQLPTKGRVPSGWFTAAARARRRGLEPLPTQENQDTDTELIFDATINRDRHEGGWQQGAGQPGVLRRIQVGRRTLRFDQPPDGVTGTVHTMVAADGKLFVVTRDGSLYCFAESETKTRIDRKRATPPEPVGKDSGVEEKATEVARWLRLAGTRYGYALVWGLCDAEEGRAAESLLLQSEMKVIVVTSDDQLVDSFRRRWDERGWYGRRITIHVGHPLRFGFPPYLATLIVVADPAVVDDVTGQDGLRRLFATLRPFGGTAILAANDAQHAAIQRWIAEAGPSDLGQATLTREGNRSVLRREGPLPGSTNYTGDW